MRSFTIGIDIGATNSVLGIVEDGKIIFKTSLLTSIYKRHTDLIQAMHQCLSSKIEELGKSNFKGVGIGIPDANAETGNVEHAVNLNWEGVIPFAKDTEAFFNLPVKIINDAKAAAIGEMIYGAGKELQHFILLTLGTGVGAGVIINRKILLGYESKASTLGHSIIYPNGRYHPGSGLYGSLEMYCSAQGIVETALEKLADSKFSLLNDFKEALTPKIITECANKGDAIAIETLEDTGKTLGKAMANFAHFSSPQAFILFGGITGAKEFLLKPAKAEMEKNLLTAFKGEIDILIAALADSDAAILGAASLIYTNGQLNN